MFTLPGKKQIASLLLFISFSHFGFSQVNWWNQTTAYEIFVRSFYDSNADGIGDFNGLTQKLDYLNDGNANTNADLGVGLLWLMPINSTPSDHGYDVTNYYAVNPKYGTLNEFKTLLTQAHNRGIKVVMDLVLNHTSDQHPWFVKSAANDPYYRNFYRWDAAPGNQTGPWGQQVWYSKNGSNYYGLFWSGMPDLNYNYQPVKDSVFAIAKYWLKEIGIDGFRLDAAMYLFEEGSTLKNHPKTIAFWKEFNDSCESWKANSLLVGEVWDTPASIKLYTGKLDMCFEFNLADANINAISSGNPYNSRVTLNNTKTSYQDNQFATFLTNHDQNRVFDVFNTNIEMNKAAASLYLTQPGVPFLYYGEEVAMRGSKPDQFIRRPMQWSNAGNAGFTTVNPWIALNSNYANFNVSVMKADPNSLWNHYQKLIKIRKQQSVLQIGTYQNIISTHNEVHTYQRSLSGDDILVMVNTTNTNIDSVQFVMSRSDGSVGNCKFVDLMNDTSFFVMGNGQYSISLPLKPYQTRILAVDYPIGISKSNLENTMLVYPNPTSNEITIENKILAQQKLAIAVYSMNGQLVYHNESAEKLSKHSMQLPKGIYLLQIRNEIGESITQKLIIE